MQAARIRLDRLGSSAQHVLAVTEQLLSRGAGLRVLNLAGETWTPTPMGSMVFTVMA